MAKAKRTRNGNSWTEAEYFQKIRSALRKAFQYWIPMKQTLTRAQRKSQSTNKRLKFEYLCADCGGWFPRSEVEVDHKVPCGTLRSLQDIAPFVQRLTDEDPNMFQVLCKRCHNNKTQYEAQNKHLQNSLEA